MKIEEIKHNHSLTDLLKVLLFSILMLAPIASVGVRCAYVVVNKNAYQSYTSSSVEMKNETLSLIEGVQYYYGYTGNTTGETNNTTGLIEINTMSIELNSNTKYIRFSNSGTIIQYDENNDNLNLPISVDYCTYSVNSATTLQSQPWFKNYLVVYTEQKLDNVFEYSVSQLEDDTLFNWATNTGVYTGVKAMTDNLGVDIVAIPMILTYWFLLTVIYVIIDIMLKGFTTLTHMFIKKT